MFLFLSLTRNATNDVASLYLNSALFELVLSLERLHAVNECLNALKTHCVVARCAETAY